MADGSSAGADQAAKRNWELGRRLFTLSSILLFGVILGWVLFVQRYSASQAMDAAEVGIILGPLVAAAAAIERTLETIFDLVESRASKVVAFLAKTEAWVDQAESQVKSARGSLIGRAAELNVELGQTASDKLAEKEKQVVAALEAVQQRVDRAEKLLASVTVASPEYRQAKRLASLYISLALGLIIASVGSVQMLHLIGVLHEGPPWLTALDVLITGIVMATGSGPVHSLINILQQGKEALESASSFLKDRKRQSPDGGPSAPGK